MRQLRLLAPPDHPFGIYHCFSRVVDQRFVLGDAEKDFFRGLVRELAEFCQVRVLTFCLMSNHFHLLLEVPRPPPILPSADETLTALARLSGHQDMGTARHILRTFRLTGDLEGEHRWLARLHARRWNLSAFIQLLKQRFTMAYNRKVGRRGTLWEERFKSVLVEGVGRGLAATAAYIDLNPVRARIVTDPKEYRWSGYGEAAAGQPDAQAGIRRLASGLLGGVTVTSEAAMAEYRQHLYRLGCEDREAVRADGSTVRGALSREEVLAVLREKGRVSAFAFLQCRVRYFCDGAVLGTREFVERMFQANRGRFGPRRTSGARRMRGLLGEGLFTWRDLRTRVFG